MRYVILILAGALLMPLTALAAVEPSLTMQSASLSVVAGQTITVTVNINANDRTVSSATLDLRYPADKLEGVSIDKGSFFAFGLGATTIDNVGGRMNYSAGINPARTGSGTAFTLVFRGKATGSAPLSFGAATAVAVTENTNNTVLGVTNPITLSVLMGQTATATPIPTATNVYAPIYTPTPSTVGHVGRVSRVSTGPFETAVFALVVSAIATLVYVGYTNTDAFRKREIKSIAKEEEKEPFNFKQ